MACTGSCDKARLRAYVKALRARAKRRMPGAGHHGAIRMTYAVVADEIEALFLTEGEKRKAAVEAKLAEEGGA